MKYFFLLILSVIYYQCNAQDSSNNKSGLHLTLGMHLFTVPTYSFNGTDTSFNNSLSVAPFIAVGSNGFSAIYSPKFVLGGAAPGIYMHALSVEYAQYDKPKTDFAFEYTRMFFTNNASVPYTPLNNEIYTAAAFKNFWIRPKVAAGFGFGSAKATGITASTSAYDFGLSAGISHNFFIDNDNISYTLAPSILLNGGTNQYFSFLTISQYIGHGNKFGNYTKKGIGANRGNGKKKGQRSGGGVVTSTTSTVTTSSFSINNVEGNLETSLEAKSFTLRPTVSVYVPVGTAAGSGLTAFWQITMEYKF